MLSSAKPSKILTLSPGFHHCIQSIGRHVSSPCIDHIKMADGPIGKTAGKAEVVLQARLSREKGVWPPHVVLRI